MICATNACSLEPFDPNQAVGCFGMYLQCKPCSAMSLKRVRPSIAEANTTPWAKKRASFLFTTEMVFPNNFKSMNPASELYKEDRALSLNRYCGSVVFGSFTWGDSQKGLGCARGFPGRLAQKALAVAYHGFLSFGVKQVLGKTQ